MAKLWYPLAMIDFKALYEGFDAPIAALDCGEKCAPYNEWGAPFCCDTRHTVPTAYRSEWNYLRVNSNLWHLWRPDDPDLFASLQEQTPQGHVLVECLGHEQCQRDFRSLTCRAFPFFPYFNRQGVFIGLAYYWEYEDRCWVISNLEVVSADYLSQFFDAYDTLFEYMPVERENYRHHSVFMRRFFGRRKRAIPLLHRNGKAYKITPHNGRMRRVDVKRMPKFGPYEIAAKLPFPGEI